MISTPHVSVAKCRAFRINFIDINTGRCILTDTTEGWSQPCTSLSHLFLLPPFLPVVESPLLPVVDHNSHRIIVTYVASQFNGRVVVRLECRSAHGYSRPVLGTPRFGAASKTELTGSTRCRDSQFLTSSLASSTLSRT